jgi:hypothetical protein
MLNILYLRITPIPILIQIIIGIIISQQNPEKENMEPELKIILLIIGIIVQLFLPKMKKK